jgi:hypothetical protein
MPARRPQTITGLSNQALVQIDVSGGKINCFPRRACDTVIFNCWEKKLPPQARPREVRWLVTGLTPGRFVRIEPKAGASRKMFGAPLVLNVDHRCNSVTSGFPQLRVGAGDCLAWAYGIVLCQKSGARTRVLDRLDPVIIIKDYP